MKTSKTIKIANCLKFLQLSFLAASFLFTSLSHAKGFSHKLKRDPASTPDEEIILLPVEAKSTFQSLFQEDDAGIMRSMRESVDYWEKREAYRNVWNLESSGLYQTPTDSEKSGLLKRNLLKYADKRLAGELKSAEEGSTMQAIGKVEKSLRPQSEVGISKDIALKFRARALQGKAIVEVKNPWIDCQASVQLNGKVKVMTKKQFKDMGLTSGFDVNVSESEYVAYLDQEISENIKARLSSTQSGSSNVFGNDADARIEMNANFPFNF